MLFNQELEQHFVVVIWEQPDCGKSYLSLNPKAYLTVEQYVFDSIDESSAEIGKRVQAARDRQIVRFSTSVVQIMANVDIHVAEVRQFCKLDEAGERLMRSAMSQLQLSARGYHRVLKLACTIADFAGSDDIQFVHLAEALRYRPKLMAG